MSSKTQIFAKFERVFESLTTDDIIKLMVDYFNVNDLCEFLEHCQEEYDDEDCNDNEDDEDYEK